MNPQTRALALEMAKRGKPLSEIGDATGLMDKEVLALAKQASQHVGTRSSSIPPSITAGSSSTAPAAASTTLTVTPQPSPLGRLLEDASGHSIAKVRSLASRIETQLEQLRALISEHAETERKKQEEAAWKARAKADVERLEAELAAAKAALRCKKPGPKSTNTSTPSTAGCNVCGAPITRQPGQMGATPKTHPECRAA